MDRFDIPSEWVTEQAEMSFVEFVDTYYEDNDAINTETYEVGANYLAWSETKHRVVGGKAAKKAARNAYDARMRPTNLYIRFLEDKLKGWQPTTKSISTQTSLSCLNLPNKLKS